MLTSKAEVTMFLARSNIALGSVRQLKDDVFIGRYEYTEAPLNLVKAVFEQLYEDSKGKFIVHSVCPIGNRVDVCFSIARC